VVWQFWEFCFDLQRLEKNTILQQWASDHENVLCATSPSLTNLEASKNI